MSRAKHRTPEQKKKIARLKAEKRARNYESAIHRWISGIYATAMKPFNWSDYLG